MRKIIPVIVIITGIILNFRCREYLGNGELPSYLMTIPRPSSYTVVPLNQISLFSKCRTYGEVDSVLSSELKKSGYLSLNYYSIPKGFLISAGLERIKKDGGIVDIDRWNAGRKHFDPSKNFLENIISILATQNKSYFRIFQFAFTDTLLKTSNDTISITENNGAPVLPFSYRAKNFSNAADCYVFVYEFEYYKSISRINFVENGRLSVPQHLKGAMLVQHFSGKTVR